MRRVLGGIFLGLAIIFEVSTTTFITLSESFTRPEYVILCFFSILGMIYFLGKSLESIPLSIAYAIWVGLGTVLITIISILVFGDQLDWYKSIGLVLVIGGVISLNYFSDKETGQEQEKSVTTSG